MGVTDRQPAAHLVIQEDATRRHGGGMGGATAGKAADGAHVQRQGLHGGAPRHDSEAAARAVHVCATAACHGERNAHGSGGASKSPARGE